MEFVGQRDHFPRRTQPIILTEPHRLRGTVDAYELLFGQQPGIVVEIARGLPAAGRCEFDLSRSGFFSDNFGGRIIFLPGQQGIE